MRRWLGHNGDRDNFPRRLIICYLTYDICTVASLGQVHSHHGHGAARVPELERLVPGCSHEARVVGRLHPVAGLHRRVVCCHLQNSQTIIYKVFVQVSRNFCKMCKSVILYDYKKNIFCESCL